MKWENKFKQYISRYGTILAKDSGNVGIGTTNPKYKLDVAGQIGSNIGFCIGGNCINSWSKGTAYLSYAGCGAGDTEVARWTEYTRTVYNYNQGGGWMQIDSYENSPGDPGYETPYYQAVATTTASMCYTPNYNVCIKIYSNTYDPTWTERVRWTEYTRTFYNYNAYGETDSYVKSPVDPGYLPGLGYDIYYQHVSSYTARIICK